MRHYLLTFAAGALGCLSMYALIASVEARADGLDTTENVPRLIPYEGLIELDGIEVNGALDMRFSLRDATDSVVWTEEFTAASSAGAVDVFAGRFSVSLGSTVDLTAAIYDGEPLFIAVEVADGLGGWTLLDGRQSIASSPYAMWAAEATDLQVNGTLTVDNGGNITGLTTLQTVDLQTNLSSSTGSLLLADDVDISGGLNLSGALTNTATNARVTINDDVEVSGGVNLSGTITNTATNAAVTINDDLVVTGTLTMGGTIDDSNTHVTIANHLAVEGIINDYLTQTLRLNTLRGRPIQIAVDSQAKGTGGNSDADAYTLASGEIGGVECTSSSRGALVIGTPDDLNRDALCACFFMGGTAYDWVCFSH